MLAGVDAAAWPVFIEERSRERKLGTSVSGRILSAGPGVPSPPPSTYNSASARLQPSAPRHADPSFIKVRAVHAGKVIDALGSCKWRMCAQWPSSRCSHLL